MLNTILERAQIQLDKSLPFVLYSKPGELILKAMFQSDSTLHRVTDYREQGFVFAPFLSDDTPILITPDEVLTTSFKDEVLLTEFVKRNTTENTKETERYKALVQKAILEIKSGNCKKIVLSRQITVNQTRPILELYNELLKIYPNAFCYLWHHPKVGTWLGATPEILIKTKGLAFTTMSLAGTQTQTQGQNQPKWSNKELDEQQLVTDYIQSVLEKRTKQVHFSKAENVQAGHLWHLRTKITGTFSAGQFKELVNALHPTPAVCGLPLDKARSFILKNEQYDRSFYTGFLGELNFKTNRTRNRNQKNHENNAYRSVTTTSELFVNLRCMQLTNSKALVYVGGGITVDSDVEKEWLETQSKAQTMLRILDT